MDDESAPSSEKYSARLWHVLEDIWPSIYRAVNALFFGFFQFLKFILGGLWPGK
ncbi:MAG: hypothetical protein UV73_C0002G0059 [Candidatus Gottesmanbacteria bacterium GW2011_GWA2_43_14]|uniref:Uncharacterized protein n=1 Tax=Candidatus Gottesmanbacteria bacterium GW2011_GWA2_43_14 TaxID=1618443 RepID=A0A0G1DKG3_9BACT|nr:MAG: hypothetical protein UV73_C0002G0059 [Candidatus Gottesmanbacteria bacterium GW2011_GWA2_43_14]